MRGAREEVALGRSPRRVYPSRSEARLAQAKASLENQERLAGLGLFSLGLPSRSGGTLQFLASPLGLVTAGGTCSPLRKDRQTDSLMFLTYTTVLHSADASPAWCLLPASPLKRPAGGGGRPRVEGGEGATTAGGI
jgi:hypothetical protein